MSDSCGCWGYSFSYNSAIQYSMYIHCEHWSWHLTFKMTHILNLSRSCFSGTGFMRSFGWLDLLISLKCSLISQNDGKHLCRCARSFKVWCLYAERSQRQCVPLQNKIETMLLVQGCDAEYSHQIAPSLQLAQQWQHSVTASSPVCPLPAIYMLYAYMK